MTETIAEPVARRSWVEQIMGMPISVHLRSSEPGAALSPAVELAVAEVFDDLRWVDETFSTYRPSSEVMRLNRGELTADESHPAVQEVIALCEEAVAGPTAHSTPTCQAPRAHAGSIPPGW